MNLLRLKIILIFCALSGSTVVAQEQRIFLELFKSAMVSTENMEYCWKIERTFEPNDDELASLKREYEAKINAVDPKDPQASTKIADLQKQWDVRKSIFGVQRKKEIEVVLSYLNPRQWYAQQIFFDKNITITNDYYCSKSGIINEVSDRARSVTVYHNATSTLGVIASAQSLFLIEHLLDKLHDIHVLSEDAKKYELKLEMENYGYFIARVDKATFYPEYLCHYFNADRKDFEARALGPVEKLGLLPKKGAFSRFASDGKKVDYHDVWKLVSIRPIVNPTSIRTDYQLKPGYQVTIFDGPKMVRVRSDEIINKKK